jgi:hypothetical protein
LDAAPLAVGSANKIQSGRQGRSNHQLLSVHSNHVRPYFCARMAQDGSLKCGLMGFLGHIASGCAATKRSAGVMQKKPPQRNATAAQRGVLFSIDFASQSAVVLNQLTLVGAKQPKLKAASVRTAVSNDCIKPDRVC